MNITRLPLSELKKPKRNVRLHSNKQIEEFKRSVEMFGQIRPIVVDDTYTILAGNGLYEALSALGRTEADCYIVSGLSETEKKKLMLADNRIFNLGIDDMQAFDEIIAELDNDFDIPGYDPDLLKTLTIDLCGADDLMSGYGIISDDTRAEMRRASETYEREDKEFAQEATHYEPARPIRPVATVSNGTSDSRNIGESPAEKPLETAPEPLKKQFIICPKCGEQIWL